MRLTWPGNLTDGHFVTPQGVAAALQRLYEDRKYSDAMAQTAYISATRPEFKWSGLIEQWKLLFEETITSDQARPHPSLIDETAQS
jgi:hypothetical protein